MVVDFGDGYGTLARKIEQRCPNTKVVIVELYPAELAKQLALGYLNLLFISDLPRKADVIIVQDVLEYVPDPLVLYDGLLQVTREGRFLITANCFYPVIRYHLLSAFHFRHSFHLIALLLGSKFVGVIPEVGHARIFKKMELKKVNWWKIRKLEHVSRMVFLLFEAGFFIFRPLWRFTRRQFNS